MIDEDLLTEVDGAIARITFNRPHVRNALTAAMLERMRDFLMQVEYDPKVRCVVIAGAGGHFMAGGDVSGFAAAIEFPGAERRRDFERRARRAAPIFTVMQRMPQPIIAKVRGAVAGAAIGWIAASDFVLASDTAKFIVAQTSLGTSPDGGITWFLPRVVGMRKAKEMALLGLSFSAKEAMACSLINRVVGDAELDAEVEALASGLASGASFAIGRAKLLINASTVHSLANQLELECKAFGDCAATDDFAEGVRAFVEKRQALFRGI